MYLPTDGYFRLHTRKSAVDDGLIVRSYVDEPRFGGNGKSICVGVGNLAPENGFQCG